VSESAYEAFSGFDAFHASAYVKREGLGTHRNRSRIELSTAAVMQKFTGSQTKPGAHRPMISTTKSIHAVAQALRVRGGQI